MHLTEAHYAKINRAFSAQSSQYDQEDLANPILTHWRQVVYHHVEQFMSPASSVLELNAGTGLDALHFVRLGHRVLATDLSDGMVERIREKMVSARALGLSTRQLSFEQLEVLQGQRFDYIFSNFGGLNCCQDLTAVTRNMSELVNPRGFVTWVIMPPFSPWELLWLLKGEPKKAFRRWGKNGTLAQVAGEFFKTYYHPLTRITRSLGPLFQLINSESLGVLSPPPASVRFTQRHPVLSKILRTLERKVGGTYPLNRWGDHIIVTYQRKKT